MRRRAALLASAILIATGILYWGILIRQADPRGVLAAVNPGTVLVSSVIIVLAALAGYGAVGRRPELRAVALWFALPGLVVFAWLAGFSIGVFFLIAAVPTLVAGVSALRDEGVRRRAAFLAAGLAVFAWAGVGAILLWLPSIL